MVRTVGIFAVLVLVARISAQMGSGRRQRDKEAVMVKEDLKHITCDVCQMAMEKLFDATEEKRAEAIMTSVHTKPGQKKEQRSSFSEQDVNDVLLEVCHRRKKGGKWIWYTDLVEVGGGKAPSLDYGTTLHRPLSKSEKSSGARFLLVANTEEPGKWDHERATLKRSCEDVVDGMADVDELVVALWKRQTADGKDLDKKSLVRLGCKELTRSCKGGGRKALVVAKPKGGDGGGIETRRADAPHEAQDKQLLETEQMMQNMEEAGSPMVMQSREDIEEEMREMAEDMGMSPEEMEALMSSGGGGDPGGHGGDELGGLGGPGEL